MSLLKSLFSNKKFLTPFIVIVSFLIIALLIGLIYTKDQPKFIPEETRGEVREGVKEEIVKPLEKVAPKVAEKIKASAYGLSSTGSIGNNNVENWQVYKSTNLGLKLEVPNNWSVYKSNETSISFTNAEEILELKELESKYRDTDFPFWGGRIVEITKLVSPPVSDPIRYIEGLFGTTGVTVENMKINNAEAYRVVDESPDRFGGGRGYYYYISLGGNWYEIALDYYLNQRIDDGFIETFERIAQSVKN